MCFICPNGLTFVCAPAKADAVTLSFLWVSPRCPMMSYEICCFSPYEGYLQSLHDTAAAMRDT